MDVAALPINLTPQPTSGIVPGDQLVDATQLGIAKGADIFAFLLAKQVGLGAADTTASEPLPAADLADASKTPDVAVDPALQLQQAAIFLPAAIVVPQPEGTPAAPLPAEVAAAMTATVRPASSEPDAVATSVTRDDERQPVAAAPAGFAELQGKAAFARATEAQRVDVQEPSTASGPVPPELGKVGVQSPIVPEEKPSVLPDKVLVIKAAIPDPVQPGSPQAVAVTPLVPPVQTPAHASASTQPSSNIPQPVGHSAWGSMLGDRVVWMVSQQHQGVELHLNPPSLGPLDVKLSMSDGQANLSFMTQHLPVKEAIESATGRLREMLGDSGISLGSVSVNLGSFSQPQQQQADGQSQGTSGRFDWAGTLPAGDAVTSTPVVHRLLNGNGMVDTFA